MGLRLLHTIVGWIALAVGVVVTVFVLWSMVHAIIFNNHYEPVQWPPPSHPAPTLPYYEPVDGPTAPTEEPACWFLRENAIIQISWSA
jgi:hypothetical protein